MKKFPIILLLIHSLFQLTAQINEKVQLANEYYQQGDYEKASELFEDLKDNKPNIIIDFVKPKTWPTNIVICIF